MPTLRTIRLRAMENLADFHPEHELFTVCLRCSLHRVFRSRLTLLQTPIPGLVTVDASILATGHGTGI